MKREEQMLLELLRASLFGTSIQSDPSLVDWEKVYEGARMQAVLLLAFDGVAQIKEQIPQDLYAQWQREVFLRLRANMQVSAAQDNLVALLEEGNHPYVILKGLAAAAYYERAELRHLGDVDFLVNPAQREQIAQKLVERGFARSLEDHICHQVFRKPGAHLEMHHEPAGIPKGIIGEQLREVLADAVERAIQRDGFCAPSHFDHGLILLLHMQHHMVSEGLGLRHLCDWGCFVHQTIEASFWEELLPLLKNIGLFRYAQIMTAVCSRAFETACPAWVGEIEGALVDAVLEDVFLGGNFGRNNPKRAASGIMVSDHGKDGVGGSKAARLYGVLHRSSLKKYPFVKKSKILWFLIDCLRSLRYLGLMLLGKRYVLSSLSKDANQRISVYENFELFKTVE